MISVILEVLCEGQAARVLQKSCQTAFYCFVGGGRCRDGREVGGLGGAMKCSSACSDALPGRALG